MSVLRNVLEGLQWDGVGSSCADLVREHGELGGKGLRVKLGNTAGPSSLESISVLVRVHWAYPTANRVIHVYAL